MNSDDIIVNLNSVLDNKWWVNSTSSIDIDTLVALKYIPFNNNVQTIGGISNIHVENFSRSVYEWRIGTLQNFDNYTTGILEMYQGNNTQWVTINNAISWNSNGEVYLNNNKLLYYQLYRVSFYDRDYNYTQTYGYYFLPIGESITSGDSLIYNGNDNNNASSIINQMEENQNFWQQAYNNLFTISGDYVEQKFEEIRNKYNISGDKELEEEIINVIQNQANDFIISWEDGTTHFSINGQQLQNQLTIPQNYINFSQMERENQDFHTSMEWARTIIGFSLGMLLLRNYWTTLLLMLGVGIQVYDKETQEKDAINQTITIDKNGKQTLTTTQKIGNLTIRRKK